MKNKLLILNKKILALPILIFICTINLSFKNHDCEIICTPKIYDGGGMLFSFMPDICFCDIFYYCDEYNPLVQMQCPEGLHWNQEKYLCDWPWDAGCPIIERYPDCCGFDDYPK